MAELAIVVATRDREAPLRRLLASALALDHLRDLAPALVVVDDGGDDRTPDAVAEAARGYGGVRYLRASAHGKARALNQAIRATAARLLAFVDDDVEFERAWLVAAVSYFARHDVAAAQGTIRLPPAATQNAALMAACARWRTIPTCDPGPSAGESGSLIGANMLVPRATFARVGLFDERLGPGAAGASEDTELARRIRAAGGRIGFVPDAIVYHAVDPTRLTAAYFRTLHATRGRSRIYYKDTGLARHILPNLGVAAVKLALATAAGLPRARTRALGRWYHYRAMLAAARGPRLSGRVPPLDGS